MEQLLSVREVAAKLSLSTHCIRSWLFQGKLPHVRLGRRIAFRPQDIDSFVEKNLVQARKKA